MALWPGCPCPPRLQTNTFESNRFTLVLGSLVPPLALAPPPSLHVSVGGGRPLDAFGHHPPACARAGGLGERRDFDLVAPNPRDQRRLEILADGLPLFGGAQLAVDTMLVSPLHCDGSPHLGLPMWMEPCWLQPEGGRRGRTQNSQGLAAGPVWSFLQERLGEDGLRRQEGFCLFWQRRRPWSEHPIMKKRAEQAWRLRWGAILGCAGSPRFCSIFAGAQVRVAAPMGTSRPRTRW